MPTSRLVSAAMTVPAVASTSQPGSARSQVTGSASSRPSSSTTAGRTEHSGAHADHGSIEGPPVGRPAAINR
jgi:hypothetical protein